MSTVVITIWLTVTKYPYLKLQWIFYFSRRCCCLRLSLPGLLPDLTVYMSNIAGIYKKQELFALREHVCVHFGGVRVAHLS